MLAAWLHRMDVLKSLFKPTLDRMREGEIRDRTQALQRRAWGQNEHVDDRDLAARLQDSLHASGQDSLSEDDEMYLPGLGPMPTEWNEPDPPEAQR